MGFDGFTMTETDISRPDREGRVYLRHAGREIIFRFDWWAIASMQEEWGDAFLETAAKGLDQLDVQTLAQMAAFGSGKNSGDVMDMSFPIVPLADALGRAWRAAWRGTDALIEEAEETTGKKRQTLRGLFARLWNRLCRLASLGKGSGK